MALSEPVLALRARRAYERGRLQAALWPAVPLVPLVAWTLGWCRYPALAAVCGTALVVLTVAFGWRGRAWGRAIAPGLLAGLPPLVIPLLMRDGSEVCVGAMCCSLCLLGCVGGGLVAGLLVGRRAAALREGRGAFLAGAGALALLAGAPACVFAGVIGLAALALGFAAGMAPPLVLQELHRQAP